MCYYADQATRRIVGVQSKSNKAPLKQANFPEPYQNQNFSGKDKYSDWKFLSTISSGLTGTIGNYSATVSQP